MKIKLNFLKFGLPFIAVLLLAAGVFAMNAKSATVQAIQNPPAVKYFKYTGSDRAGYYNASNWVVSDAPPTPCSQSTNTCTVQSASLQTPQEIADLLNNGGTQLEPNADHGSDYQILSKRGPF